MTGLDRPEMGAYRRRTRAAAMRRYYFPIFHNGETKGEKKGELFGSAELAIQYGARVARDIGSDPEYDRGSGTVVIVVDDSGAEIERRELRGGRKPWR